MKPKRHVFYTLTVRGHWWTKHGLRPEEAGGQPVMGSTHRKFWTRARADQAIRVLPDGVEYTLTKWTRHRGWRRATDYTGFTAPLDELSAALNELDPVCHPMVHALVIDGVLTPRDVQRMVEAGEAEAALDVVSTSVDTVIPRQRTLLRQLAVQREGEVGSHSVDPEDFAKLVERGLVVQQNGQWSVPLLVQQLLVPQARALGEIP